MNDTSADNWLRNVRTLFDKYQFVDMVGLPRPGVGYSIPDHILNPHTNTNSSQTLGKQRH
jgi:hypothetical protein